MNHTENAFKISVQRFDDYAKDYAQRFSSIGSYQDSVDKFCELITSSKPCIIDLACGHGRYTQHLRKQFSNSKITAVDLAPRMIDIAKQALPDVDFKLMDIRSVAQLPDVFDAILCSFGLPFLSKEDAAKLIADCAAKLKNHGVLYISTMEGCEADAGFETTSFAGSAEIYFNYHRLSDLKEAFEQNGLHLEWVKEQDYAETDGSITTDLILIGVKK